MENEPVKTQNLDRNVSYQIPESDFEYIKLYYASLPFSGSGFSEFLYAAAKAYLMNRYTDAPSHLQAQIKMLDMGKNPHGSHEELIRATGWPGPGQAKSKLFTVGQAPFSWKGFSLYNYSLGGLKPRWEK